jgi:hypothetical protein
MKLIRRIVDSVGYVQGVVRTFNECVKLFRTMREEQSIIESLSYPGEESFGKFIQDNFKQGGVIERGNYPDSVAAPLRTKVEIPKGQIAIDFHGKVYSKNTLH